jgi:rhamnosyltransferase
MHDWWLALVAAATGQVLYAKQALVLYRQHSHNASGGSKKKGLLDAIRAMFRTQNLFFKLMSQRFAQICSLQERLTQLNLPRKEVDLLVSLLKHWAPTRVRVALETEFLPQGLERQLLFIFLLIIWNPSRGVLPNKT